MSHYSATKLGQMMDPPLKAVEVNKLLEERGYQERDPVTTNWRLTTLGEKYGIETSTKIGIIVWRKTVLSVLNSEDVG